MLKIKLKEFFNWNFFPNPILFIPLLDPIFLICLKVTIGYFFVSSVNFHNSTVIT